MAAREFIPYLQPVMDRQGRLRGCEVLMRWRHPTQGMIAPNHFIPLAEECGYIVPMTRQLMAQTRDYLLEVADRLPPAFTSPSMSAPSTSKTRTSSPSAANFFATSRARICAWCSR